MDRGDVDSAAAHFADTGINHGMTVTRDQIRMVLRDLVTTFAATTELQTLIADGDWVSARTITRGKHVGKNVIPINMLSPGTEPTNREFTQQIIHMFRLSDGKITEHWAGRDDLGLHWQLGLIPAPDWYKARMA